jgi:hypothetical protein
MYTTNNSSFINGMRSNVKQRIKWSYPKLSKEICTAEIHGRLFHILCDYQKIIEVFLN